MAVRYLNATGTQALINEIKSRLNSKANQSTVEGLVNQLQDLSDSIPTKVSQLENDAEYLDKTVADGLYTSLTDVQPIKDAVAENTTAISVLNADDTVEGSVAYKLANDIPTITKEEIEDLW